MAELVDRLNEALADRYRIQGELGRGGMASVFLADDLRHGRQVAVKVIGADFLGPEGLRRFEAEIRTTAALHHPNILPLFDSGTVGDVLFYVMPVVSGESLQERLDREGALPPPEAGRIAASAARALAYAHAHGIVHRDIKPSNLLLHLGETLVADFGISRVAGTDERLTATGLSLGTPHYMSPEQLRDAHQIDGRSDQYALGCVLFEMLAGHPPFPMRSAHAVLAAHLTQAAPELRLKGEAAMGLASVVRTALSKDPADRFESMGAFAEGVEAALSPPSRRTTADRPSLVVLPFANLSSDPDDAFFSDGLTVEVIGDLSRIDGLRVISRTTAMQYKETTLRLPEIAAELGVTHALEGSVRKAGNRLRVTAQLIATATDEHVWSDRFDGVLDDVFEIQDRVSASIAEALSIVLTPAERKAIQDRRVPDAQALELLMQARQAAWTFHVDKITTAISDLQKVTEGRDDHLQLLFGLGYLHFQVVNCGVRDSEAHYRKLDDCIARMEALDPGNAYAAFLLGLRHTHVRLSDALGHFLTAYEGGLSRDEDVLYWLSVALIFGGHGTLADRFHQELIDIAPGTVGVDTFRYIRDVYRGRWADAFAAWSVARPSLGDSPIAVFIEAWSHAVSGVSDEVVARMIGDRAEGLEDRFGALTRMLKCVHEGRRDEVLAVDDETLAVAWNDAQFAAWVADLYAGVGIRDRALRWLRRGVELGFLLPDFISRHDPYLAGLRDDPEFKEIVRDAQLRQARLRLELDERIAGWEGASRSE